MVERPKSVMIASGVAILGALFVLAVIILELDVSVQSLGLKMAIYLLLLVLFIAIAGSLFSDGQWSWRFLISVEVFCAALPVVAYIMEIIDLYNALAFVVISCVAILFSTTKVTKRWIESDRI
ncbi:MAG: hypothetical protein LBE48_04400 [Methanomassiliicoccaceae archaeon]|jgi:asparagine N-glycosylation enzyme membrane subunit Stt3|nr:hypothetical protein [Methanomassiliicoccaceae archaeon]